jgi:hypothetical protein
MPARLRWAHGRVTATVVVVVGLAVAACNRGRVVDSTLPKTSPPARAADSFVHCVEAGTSNCVDGGEQHGGWDALQLLLWLSSGSPVSILEMLPRELDRHTDNLAVQAAFVDEVERYAEVVRGAECQSVATQPLRALVDQSARVAARSPASPRRRTVISTKVTSSDSTARTTPIGCTSPCGRAMVGFGSSA